jgi:DNA-binding IclR family transcriptional regulator
VAKRSNSEGRGIQSIEVGGRLLHALAEADGPMMLRDLAASAGLAPAQAHAYLVSYRRASLVEQDAASGMYRLGYFALRLGLARMRSVEPLASASRTAVRLSNDVGLMVALVVWGPMAPTAVQVQEGAHTLNINVHEGTIFSVTGSAAGRTFAAFSNADAIGRRIDQELGEEPGAIGLGVRPPRKEFAAEIDRIRRRGYSSARDAPIPGINVVAAPVFDASCLLALAVTLIGPAAHLDLRRGSTTIGRLLAACSELSSIR